MPINWQWMSMPTSGMIACGAATRNCRYPRYRAFSFVRLMRLILKIDYLIQLWSSNQRQGSMCLKVGEIISMISAVFSGD